MTTPPPPPTSGAASGDPSGDSDKAAKPFYKKWWFIAAAVVVVLAAIGSGTEPDEGATANLAAASDEESTDATADAPATTEAPTTTQPATTTTTAPTTTTTTAPTTTTTTLPAWEAYTVEGSGDSVIDFAVPGDDPAVPEFTYSSGSNFSVWSYTATGTRLDLLVNEIGAYQGARPVNFLDGETVGELEISASGPWTVRVRPLFDSPELATSLQGTGSEVIVYTASASRLEATHQGSSNFVVRAWSTSGRDLLVNEIGAYTGTVRIDPSTVIIEVEADGAWTLQTG